MLPLGISFWVLLKVQIITALIFALFGAWGSITSSDFASNGLLFFGGYFVCSSIVFYGIGLPLHRFFLAKSLFSQKYLLILAGFMSVMAFLIYFFDIEKGNWERSFSAAICFAILIILSCELIGYFTKQELRRNDRNNS